MQAPFWVVLGSIIASVAPAQADAPVPADARATPAPADTVWALDETALHARPHETARALSHADKGAALEVVATRGRWLRVRRGTRVGWVTRIQVGTRDPAAPAGPVKRAERGGFSGKPITDAVKLTIQIDRVRGFDDPVTKANTSLDLVRDDVVTLVGRGHRGWILVTSQRGKVGWIPESAVGDAGKFVAAREVHDEIEMLPVERVTSGSPPAASLATRIVGTLTATAGAQTFSMRQVGDRAALALASGPLASIAARGHVRILHDGWVGLGGNADLGTAELIYYSTTEQSKPMPTRQVVVDAYGEIGWGNDRWHVATRGGYHHASLSIESDRAEAMLIGERIAGITVGLATGMMITRRVSFSAAVDVMPSGDQRLSEPLPDGGYANDLWGAWTRTMLEVRLWSHVAAAVAYRGTVIKADLTDGATPAKLATRTDLSHAVTAGVGVAW